MLGLVFNKLIDFVTEQHGVEVAEQVIEACNFRHGGAYTAFDTYDHKEVGLLLAQLERVTGDHPSDACHAFGQYLFRILIDTYPDSMKGIDSSFDVFRRIDYVFHVFVRNTIPASSPPSIGYEDVAPGELILIYRSSRGMADLAEGLIVGCIKYFNEQVTVERLPMIDSPGEVRFHLRAAT